MEAVKTAAPTTVAPAPAVNGTTAPEAPVKARRGRVKREVPVITCKPTAAEHAEIDAYVTKLVGASQANELGIKLNFPLDQVVLALALKHIRAAAKK